jgi:hypothetical protein
VKILFSAKTPYFSNDFSPNFNYEILAFVRYSAYEPEGGRKLKM